MNYLSKIILQQLLPQFVEVPSDSLNVQQSGIKLSKGQIKRDKYNPILQKIGIKIDQCSYANIFIEVPWMEIYKKPIKITIEELNGKLRLLNMRNVSSDSSIPQVTEQIEVTSNNPSVSAQYLKSILKRLLFNMEITIKSIIFEVKNEQDLNLTLNITNINIKNSKLSEDSKDIIKTVLVEKMSICLNARPLLEIKGFNLCLDVGQEHLKAICLLSSIFIGVNFKELRLIKDSITQFTTKPASRKNSLEATLDEAQIDAILVKQTKKSGKKLQKDKQKKNISKTIQLFVKVFQIEITITLSQLIFFTISIRNIQFTQNTKNKTKTKFSLTELKIKQKSDVIFGIRSSKSQSNSYNFINYSNMQQKTLSDPQFQIETLSQQHTCIKLYYVELYGTQKLFQLLKLHLKSIIDNITYLVESPHAEYQPSSSTSIKQLAPPPPPITITTTVIIYQGMINISHHEQVYKLYLSIQYVIDNGCLYQFDTFQISIRNANVEILKVFDSQISITEDDIYIKVEVVQVQLWRKGILFFKDLAEGIIGIVNAVNTDEGQKKQISQSKQKIKQPDQSIDKPAEPKYKYLILVRNCKIVLGNIIPKQESYKFIDLLELSIKDIKVIISNPNSLQCGAVISFIFTDQHSLLQQSISNPIHISFQNIHSKDISIKLLNNVSLKLESRYLKYIFNTLNQTSTYISVTNFTKRKLKIACEGCASVELETKVNTNWFPLVRSFRLESYQSKGITNYMNLDLEMDIDKQVELTDSRQHVIIRLVKTRISSYHIVIKPSFKIINCVRDFIILSERTKLNIFLKKYDYQSIDFEDQYSALHKSQDIHDLEKIIDSGAEDGILFQNEDKQRYMLKELVTKDNVTLFAFESLLHKNYCNYAMKKNTLIILMPFLSLKNNTDYLLKISIEEKKTSLTLDILLQPNSEFIPSNNAEFDFYMRQLTIKVSLEAHESQAYYFNTFAFLSEPHSQIIPLRSSQKGILQRRHIIIKQTAKLRSKYLEFDNPTTFINYCEFDLNIKIDQRGILIDKHVLKTGNKVDVCVNLKSDYLILVHFEDQVETKVSIECNKLKSSPYVVSFNFCKIKDKFKNILVLCELSKDGDHQLLTFKPFVTIMNLTSVSVMLDQKQLLPNNSYNLPLVINSDNTFNNQHIKLQHSTPSQLFELLLKNMEDKKEQNDYVSVGGSRIMLNKFIQKTLLQVTKISNKKILRMVKDTHKKISLYIIEGIHLDSADEFKYSLISNNTDYHFLLSEEPIFDGLFVDNQEKHSHKLKKLLIEPRTTSTIIPKYNYNVLLCNEKGEKLNQLKTQTMQLKELQEQKNTFERVETKIFQRKVKEFRGEQFNSKIIEIQLSLDGELFLVLHIKDLKIRRLEKTKFDLLLNELLLKDIKKGVSVVALKQNNYAILDFQILGETVWMIKNMFVKFGLIQIDLRKEFLFNLIRFSKNFNKVEPKHLSDKVEKQSNLREQALIEVVRSKLFLIKNMFIEQCTINLNIQLEALVFSNQLMMPIYKLSSTSIREKKLITQLWKFYSSTLVSKFPKLSFLIQNLKHPLNILKNIYNLRQTLKSKVVEKLTYWSNANKYSPALLTNQLPHNEVIVWIINSVDRIIIFSNRSLLLQQYTPIPCRPTKLSLSSIRKISNNLNSIQIEMIEGNQIEVSILKRDQRIFNSIIAYLLQ